MESMYYQPLPPRRELQNHERLSSLPKVIQLISWEQDWNELIHPLEATSYIRDGSNFKCEKGDFLILFSLKAEPDRCLLVILVMICKTFRVYKVPLWLLA